MVCYNWKIEFVPYKNPSYASKIDTIPFNQFRVALNSADGTELGNYDSKSRMNIKYCPLIIFFFHAQLAFFFFLILMHADSITETTSYRLGWILSSRTEHQSLEVM